MLRSRSLGILAAATFAAAPALSAQIVTNGGFESGNAGWTFHANDCTGPATGNPADGPEFTGANGTGGGSGPHSGAYDMWFGAAGCTPSISQTLSTISGQSYTLSLWGKVTSAYPTNIPNMLTIMYNSSTLFSGQLTNTSWENGVWTVTGNGTDVLTIAGNNPNGATEVDDVSLTTTPEPSSMALLGSGIVGLVPMMRRRRRA